MKYKELVRYIAEITGQDDHIIKEIIRAIPNILMDLEPGERVFTPLGIFYMHQTKERYVISPDGLQKFKTHPKLQVKLKPNSNMSVKQ